MGAIRYWPVNIVAGRVESVASGGESGGSGVESVGSGSSALLLGPVAVHPTHQGEGLGGVLIRHSLAEARLQGWTQVILIGDASYYGRYGFARADLDFPPPTDKARVLSCELINDESINAGGSFVRSPHGVRACQKPLGFKTLGIVINLLSGITRR